MDEALNLSLATGREVIPGILDHIGGNHEVVPTRVMHVSLDNSQPSIDTEYARIARAYDVDEDLLEQNLLLKVMRVPFLDAAEDIADDVKRHEIDHIRIDSVQTAIESSGAGGSGDVWGVSGEAYFKALGAIRALSGRPWLSTLSLDHTKGQPGSDTDRWQDRFKETLYGSARKYARFRAVFTLLALKRSRDASNNVVLALGINSHKT